LCRTELVVVVVHGQALKLQPTVFAGLLSAPFVVVAALRGKCR
jgi:hypothetical protein